MSVAEVKMDKCKYCDSTNGIINLSGNHKKLSCASCGKYIKFVSKDENYPEVKKSHYKIIYGTPETIETKLNHCIEAGFKPQGGICSFDNFLAQAVFFDSTK